MKLFLKLFLGFHIFVYRLTNGRIMGAMGAMKVLLLTTTGRKTGQKRTIPITYMLDEQNNYVITASNGGQSSHPGWFFNLKTNSQATLQIGNKQITAVAEIASPEKRNQLWPKLIHMAPGYAQYEKQTTREIPMVILKPQ